VNKIHFNQQLINDFAENSTGWTAGVMAEFTIPVIGISADASLMYARMNNSADDKIIINGDGSGIPHEEKMFGRNFFEIPINLKYKLTIPVVEKIIKPYVFTGPNFAFRLDKNTLEELKTKTCEIAWNLGLGVELFNHLQVGAGYAFGITNILDKTNNLIGSDLQLGKNMKAQNNYWTVTAAYIF
ncbi:MAG: PorT family protein, partial [Muribaculaceae bacterium]|nr:PorT family protein [Muribaculaceae bacterium]